MASRSAKRGGAARGEATPPIRGILETAVYVDDLDGARWLYGGVLGLSCILDTPRMLTYAVALHQVLLVFRRGMTAEDSETNGGTVPGHHSEGPAHFAFSVDADAYESWTAYLPSAGVPITSEVTWPKGGRSLYFNDPDGNVLEMATAGLWERGA